MALPTSQSGEAFPPRPAFACTVEHRARHVVVSLRGELDLAAAPELRHRVLELMALPVDRVTVDMGALTFIDSSGLHALTDAHHAAAEHHVDLVLTGVSDSARRLLELTHLTEVFDVRDDT